MSVVGTHKNMSLSVDASQNRGSLRLKFWVVYAPCLGLAHPICNTCVCVGGWGFPAIRGH